MKPTKSGFYWFKDWTSPHDSRWIPVEVQKEGEYQLSILYPGTEINDYVSDTSDLDWGEEIVKK